MWYLYIIRCKNRALYTGITTDPQRRFREHQHGGARYTGYNPATRLLYVEKCRNRSAALKREAQIKRLSRPQKLALIRGTLSVGKQRLTG